MCSESNENTQNVIGAGFLSHALRLLMHSKVKVRQQCLWTLSNIAGLRPAVSQHADFSTCCFPFAELLCSSAVFFPSSAGSPAQLHALLTTDGVLREVVKILSSNAVDLRLRHEAAWSVRLRFALLTRLVLGQHIAHTCRLFVCDAQGDIERMR